MHAADGEELQALSRSCSLQKITVEDADRSLSSQEARMHIHLPSCDRSVVFYFRTTGGQGTPRSMQRGVERTNSFVHIADHRTCA